METTARSLFYFVVAEIALGCPWDMARSSEEQCSIGFQPVSGQATRNSPQPVIHGTCKRYHLTWTKKTGWKTFYITLRTFERCPNAIPAHRGPKPRLTKTN
jgi:hypothetical protein